MNLLRCPSCGEPTWLESLDCDACGKAMMLVPTTLTMVPADPAGIEVDGRLRVPCSNRSWRCNWSVPVDAGLPGCFGCRLTRNRPDRTDTIAMEKLADAATSKRRLVTGLVDLGLPVVPYWRVEGGLAFDLLSSHSGNGPVVIGHANGVITIDLAESLDDHREKLRVQLGEPYRTMLGHFRHEVGHYYQWQLVEQIGGAILAECRELFGDETVSYSDAISRHYSVGAPPDWADSYLSEYATMHPWEDFAETFAHYQHIVSTLTTVANGGLQIDLPGVHGGVKEHVRPRASYADATMSELLDDWRGVAYQLNRANRAMGKGDLYPFRIPGPVEAKLDFVHRVVQVSRVDEPLGPDEAAHRVPVADR